MGISDKAVRRLNSMVPLLLDISSMEVSWAKVWHGSKWFSASRSEVGKLFSIKGHIESFILTGGPHVLLVQWYFNHNVWTM